jgi:ribonuclease BN (tRNA processing enzyme)
LPAGEEPVREKKDQDRHWRGKIIEARVLYSRAGVAQHIWLEAANSCILVDAGDGIVRDLLANKLDPLQLDGVLFTHGHFDHMGGLHSLLGYLRMIGRKGVLSVFAPKGCLEVFSVVENFLKLYADTLPFEISARKIEPNQSFRAGDLTVKAYPMIHCGGIEGFGILDPIPALGYRITCEGETVAITGDCGSASPLRELVKDADLAIIEATYRNSSEAERESLERVHLSEDMASEYGKLANQFILIHKAKED